MISLKKFFLLSALALPLASCGSIANIAKESARDWWLENRVSVVDSVTNAATTFWDENKDNIIEAAKQFASDNKEEAIAIAKDLLSKGVKSALDTAKEWAKDFGTDMLADAKNYTDQQIAEKMAEQGSKVRERLAAKGIDISSFDTNGDGNVDDDELAAGLVKNPSSLLAAGAPGLILLLLYGLRRATKKE